jgi:hypothetical protein
VGIVKKKGTDPFTRYSLTFRRKENKWRQRKGKEAGGKIGDGRGGGAV